MIQTENELSIDELFRCLDEEAAPVADASSGWHTLKALLDQLQPAVWALDEVLDSS